eukprot:COSAG02_NODE_58584_length_277_cov_0.567416_1_plen_79_part_01
MGGGGVWCERSMARLRSARGAVFGDATVARTVIGGNRRGWLVLQSSEGLVAGGLEHVRVTGLESANEALIIEVEALRAK